MQFRLLYQDPRFVIVDKPAGVHVHPPEDGLTRVPKHENGLATLRDQLGQKVYPVHRLDRATSGALIYALDSEMTALLQKKFQRHEVEKIYVAVARGRMEKELTVTRPLDGADESETKLIPIATQAFPFSVRPEFETTLATLLLAYPKTGRFHQIRRHLTGIAHPILGDSTHGDTKLNRAFATHTERPGLWLKAYRLRFRHPLTGEQIDARSRWGAPWLDLFDRFGQCPIAPGSIDQTETP